MKKRILGLLMCVALLCTVALASAEAPLRIGIIQVVDHMALNAAKDGFVQALTDKGYIDGESVQITFQNGQGDVNNLGTIADKFVGDRMDLVLAIATPSAQAIAGKTADIPIIATAVTDFVDAGLVLSNENPGTNVSGTSDMNPIEEQIELLLRFVPDAKTVGFLYNSSETNSVLQVDVAKSLLDARGIAYVEYTVSNTNEVQQAAMSIVGECDAIYLPTDNVFASSMPVVSDVTTAAGVPVFCGERFQVEGGGLATLGINYYNLGYQAGEMAVRVLEGADISTMPIETISNFDYAINGDTVDALGIEVPDDLQEFVFRPSQAD